MTIKVGDRLPEVKFMTKKGAASRSLSISELCSGKKVVLFAVPGAFTPTCTMNHLPSFIKAAEAIRAKGVDLIACTAVNDHFVMAAWGKASGAQEGEIIMLADNNADFARAVDLTLDLTSAGMGIRSKRYSMIVEDGVVTALNIEADSSAMTSSDGATILSQL